jgi:hypothetical protein
MHVTKITFNDKLALKFAPTYVSSAEEDRYLAELERETIPKIALGHPPWRPCIYYSIRQYASRNNQDFYEINYLSIWDKDTGGILGQLNDHSWDTERTAVLVRGPAGGVNPSSFKAEEVYYAAHEGESINLSTYIQPADENRGATVYCSLGKHASYPTYPPSFLVLFDQFKQPETKTEPPNYKLANAGTIDSPTDSAPWIKYKEPWGPDRVSSVYSKLKDPLWSPKPGSSKWIQNRPGTVKSQDDVKHLQAAFGLQPSGIIDPDFLDKASVLSPELIRNANRMDTDLLAKVVRLQPTKLRPDEVAVAKRGVALISIISPKGVKGKKGVKAVHLGQLSSDTIIYGIVQPGETHITEVLTASIGTAAQRQIASADLKGLS